MVVTPDHAPALAVVCSCTVNFDVASQPVTSTTMLEALEDVVAGSETTGTGAGVTTEGVQTFPAVWVKLTDVRRMSKAAAPKFRNCSCQLRCPAAASCFAE